MIQMSYTNHDEYQEDDHWTEEEVFRMLVNPVFVGIGPFPHEIDGIEVEIGEYPRIVDDTM